MKTPKLYEVHLFAGPGDGAIAASDTPRFSVSGVPYVVSEVWSSYLGKFTAIPENFKGLPPAEKVTA